MSVKIPSSFGIDLDVDLDVSGIPTDYDFQLSKIDKIDIGLDPIDIRLAPVEIKPMDISFRIKEIPSIRAHFPVDYRLGLALMGNELLTLRLCGQAQTITEPYQPNPCECPPAQPLPKPPVKPVG